MQSWNDPSLHVEERIDLLMAELSLEEKVAQLGSFWPVAAAEVDGGSGDVAPMTMAFSQAHAWENATEHGLGHITRSSGAVPLSVVDGIAQLRRLQVEAIVPEGRELCTPVDASGL